MSDNTEAINQIKDTVKNITNNPNVQAVINRMDKDRERLMNFIKNNKLLFIGIVLGTTLILFYFIAIFRRVPRYLGRMKDYDNIINVQPLEYNKTVMKGDFKFCDFFVASSYKSYLPCTNYYDFASLESIKQVLLYGARYIDLDIFNNDFNPCTKPVVCSGTEIGNWHFTNSLDFDDVCKTIINYGLTAAVKNPSDPLIINLNFKTWGNKDTIDKCAETIRSNFGYKLLSKNYSYQGRYTSTNIATAPIKELIGKVIITATGKIKGTAMDEITNLHPESNSNLRKLNYQDVRDSYDINEIKEYNKRNLSLVVPDFDKRKKENYNYFTPYAVGCQFLCMNYTQPNEIMKSYIKKFAICSFRLKPYKLRYKPIYIKPPLKQTKKVSFAPKKKTTPFYSITY